MKIIVNFKIFSKKNLLCKYGRRLRLNLQFLRPVFHKVRPNLHLTILNTILNRNYT